jgi:peroxiredoxin Q/BCP
MPRAPDLELPNVAAGPAPCRLSARADDVDVVLQRDCHSPNCRQQVQDVADRHDEFRERPAADAGSTAA